MQIFAEQAKTEHKKYRISLNTKDVTKLCIAADDVENWADMLVLLPDGSFLPDSIELEQDNQALEFEAALLQIKLEPMQTKPKVQRYTGVVVIDDLTDL